ncbi:MAG: phosphopyruvate hydratase, partial [Proteobacteria bacterium]|nr:phosphopyruvate hydratase [Pseudomonadota bacterium]
KGRQFFDSRGFPTVSVDVELSDGSLGSSIVPSGASTGSYEAHELRDQNDLYLNKSVFNAINNINTKISLALEGKNSLDQNLIDKTMLDLDGSPNKKNLGANAILGVSIANCKAAAISKKLEIYQYLNTSGKFTLPFPMLNIINGGAHANNSLQIQEFMIRPDGAKSFEECMQMSFLVIQNLKKILIKSNFSTNVGDEGGFAPSLKNDEAALDLILEAIEISKYKPGIDFNLCLDVAANELFDGKNYNMNIDNPLNNDQMISFYENLVEKYPIKSIEDPIFEDDWVTWNSLTEKIGNKSQIVGDDLFVTNPERLKKGIHSKSANAILIKVNQIGTVTETLKTIQLAQENNFNTIISHRSGDTEDTFISDLAVATNSNQIKTGSLARSERVSKYNRLLKIEDKEKNNIKMS